MTIWKRNERRVTVPFDSSDEIDGVMICVIKGEEWGLFIFPVPVLVNIKIISANGRDGKRGMRVYPAWDITTSPQAKHTQSWQLDYFVSVPNPGIKVPDRVRRLWENV